MPNTNEIVKVKGEKKKQETFQVSAKGLAVDVTVWHTTLFSLCLLNKYFLQNEVKGVKTMIILC